MSDEPKKRKITLPVRRPTRAEVTEVLEVPPVDGIISKVVATLGYEINRLYVRSSQFPLDDKEARKLQGYIKSLAELSKEQREREKAADLSNLSEDELFEIAKSFLAKHEDKSDV